MKKIVAITTLTLLAIAAPVLFFNKAKLVNTISGKKSNLTAHAQILTTKQECIDAFGKNGARLLKGKKKKIYPIKVQVTNIGSSPLSASLKKTDLKIAPQKTVYYKLQGPKLSDLLKAVGLGVVVFAGCIAGAAASSALFPVTFSVTCPGMTGSSLGFWLPLSFFGAAIVAPPATTCIYAVKTTCKSWFNKKKAQKLFGSETLTLKPGETKTIFLFVQACDYKEQFSLTFSDSNGDTEDFICSC